MKQDTNMRVAFPVETRVLAGLWRLATGNTYLSGGIQFWIGKSTAQNASTESEMHFQHEEMTLLDFLQPITRSKQLLITLRCSMVFLK